ncbi:hypothetical protein WMF38_26485 [Sorangium sp. So ce118]
MLKNVSYAVIMSILSVFATSCGAAKTSTLDANGIWVDGYSYGFQVPRADIVPGTVIVAWDDDNDTVGIICTPEDYGGAPLTKNPAIGITQTKKENIEANAEARIAGIVAAKVKGKYSKSVAADVQLTPLVLADQAGAANRINSNPKCVDNAATFRKSYGSRIKFFSLVTESAQVTYTYDVKLDAGGELSAEALKEIEAEIGGGAKVAAASAESLKITGEKVFVNYNRDDSLVAALGTGKQ